MTQLLSRLLAAMALVALMAASPVAMAQETIRIGIVGPFTGPLAVMGKHWREGIETFLALNGKEVGGRTVEVIYRDSTGNPANARQLVQELVVRDKVSIVGGFGLTPEAAAAAPIINQARTPAFLFHTASPSLMAASPYFVRMGQNIGTNAEVASAWALAKGKKSAYVAVADYAPGHDVAKAFKAHFTANGGEVVGEDNIPLNTVDFSSFAERVASAKPEYVQMFIPPGAQAVSFVKELAARGVMKSAIVIGQGEAEDPDLHLFDGAVLGFHSSIYYSSTQDNPENEKFLEGLKSTFSKDTLPGTFTVGAYDGMHLAYRMIEAMDGGEFDGDKAMEAVRGYTWTSPRGSVTLDPETREPIQDYMIRQVQETEDGMRNVVIDSFAQVNPATFGKK